jgi:catechol 2,3-dioxygenase-like lactoylglutathione lyase family enzyme
MSLGRPLPSAILHGLFDVAIKTSDLESTRVFWRDIIGLREIARPDFGYPGAWLGCAQPGGQAIIHIYAGGPALGASGVAPRGTGAIDHVSLSCSGFRDFVARFNRAANSWCRERRCGSYLSMIRVASSSSSPSKAVSRAMSCLICRPDVLMWQGPISTMLQAIRSFVPPPESINSIELGPGLTFPMNGVLLHWFAEFWEGLGVVDIWTKWAIQSGDGDLNTLPLKLEGLTRR